MENFDQQEISIEQIRKGLKSGIVWLATEEGSIAAHIGGGWFWFSDKWEDISVSEFVSKYHDDIPEWIYQAINSEPIKEEKEDDSAEWLYYKAVLDEELKCLTEMATNESTEELIMNKQEFLNYIIDYAICTGWEDCNGKDQIRALFTSWCLIFHIDADTKECDDTLNVIYWRAAMEELIEYEDYEQFMIELIV